MKKNQTYKKNNIQKLFFRTQIFLILILATMLGIAGTLTNIHYETQKRDQNLQNVADVIAHSMSLWGDEDEEVMISYLDSLENTLDDIDVISLVDANKIRLYHTNRQLIGTEYDGKIPDFQSDNFYAVSDNGPSGPQRRAYAAIYDEQGNYVGFVMAIMLMKNIKNEIIQTLCISLVITMIAICISLLFSVEISKKVKKSLLGYEPDVFSGMFQTRDHILESLAEGVLAVDAKGVIQFVNQSALKVLRSRGILKQNEIVGNSVSKIEGLEDFSFVLKTGDKILSEDVHEKNIIVDFIPIKENENIIGAVGIIHDREEYTKLMEDLTGTKYLVDSMRANNHDFTNKLHVILGLLQMQMYEEAASYIQNITMVQRAMIHKIMNAVNDPAVAALLIGKVSRASELNIRFVLREGCHYEKKDFEISSEVLVTIIGNLVENAFEAMNMSPAYDQINELLFGIYSREGALLLTVDDTGAGMEEENVAHIFEQGYSTKGNDRGTGLSQVKQMVENFGGEITVESQIGVGSSFSVRFYKGNNKGEV